MKIESTADFSRNPSIRFFYPISKLLTFLTLQLNQIIEALCKAWMCEIHMNQEISVGLSFSWLVYSVIKPLCVLLSSAENWPKKDFCRPYRTLNLWKLVNCIQLMRYSSRSSGVWITVAESTTQSLPATSAASENQKKHFEERLFFVEVRWNDRYYREARSTKGKWQCQVKLQDRQL